MGLYGGTYVLIAQFPDHCLPVTFHATRHCVHVPVASNFGKGAWLIRGRLGCVKGVRHRIECAPAKQISQFTF